MIKTYAYTWDYKIFAKKLILQNVLLKTYLQSLHSDTFTHLLFSSITNPLLQEQPGMQIRGQGTSKLS